MRINTKILKARFRKYIDGPDSKQIWEELTNSVLFNIVGSLILIVLALILICTVILTWTGIKLLFAMIKSFLTLEVFRDPRREYLENPDRLRPLIVASIITGPSGHGLMLGTMSDETQGDAPFLARKAAEFADIYLDESGDGEGDFFDLLRDDTYHPYRRRAVPASHSEGHNLVLFDMQYNKDEIHFAQDDSAWLAAVITIDEPKTDGKDAPPNDPPPGRIVQIPWEVVENAVFE